MSKRALSTPLFDADNHLYETREALTKYLPDRYRGAIDYVDVARSDQDRRPRSDQRVHPQPDLRRGRPARAPRRTTSATAIPDGKTRREIFGEPMKSIPAFREPAARLELMDEQGIDRALMFPTLASLIEERMRDDPELTHAAIHALNQWLHETWTFDYQGRIFATPVITLPIVERAIEELDWVLERGARVVLIRPAPVPGYRGPRSFGLEEFDPFWQKVVDNDILVAMHSSDSGYERYANDWMGSDSEMLPFQPQAFRMLSAWRPVEDAVSALVCHGALSRFPDLKVAVIENGSSWVEPLLKNMADIYKKMPQEFLENPVEVIKRNIYISPFWEEDLGALAELIGVDHVLFGSDFPHPEGLAEPVSYLDELDGLDEESVAKIMGGNLARLMNVTDVVGS